MKDGQAQKEHQLALKSAAVAQTVCRPLLGRLHRSAPQTPTHQPHRHQHAHQRGQPQGLDDAQAAHLPANPQHGGGDVANRRPGAARVGGDHDDAGQQQAVVVPGQQLAQQRHHHDGGGEVVEDGAEHEGDATHQPHQAGQPGGLDALGDHVKALVRVHHLDDGHGAHQEEHDLRRAHQGLTQLFGDLVRIALAQGVDRPQQASPDQGRGRLVDVQRVLQRNGQIADHEDGDEGGDHGQTRLCCVARRPDLCVNLPPHQGGTRRAV
jgi:hypothetical protein